MTSIATVPEKVADATSGSISMRYVSGSTVRGRRNASEPARWQTWERAASGEGYPRDCG